MHVSWDILAIVAVTFLVAVGLQAFIQKRVLHTAVQRYWNEKVEDSPKLVRQDVTGIIIGIGITNALLAAILVLLVIRP